MDLLTELKTRTRPHHDRVEAALNLTREGLTRVGYVGLLGAFYGLYAPWEWSAAAALPAGLRGEFDRRRKAPPLESDLRHFGFEDASLAGLPRCADLPPTDTVAAVLGAMYVIEGSTLGGQHIARHLGRTLGVFPGAGCDFFSGYGDATGAMWRLFRGWLVTHAAGHEEAVVVASGETFDRLQAWLTSVSPPG